MMSEPINAIPVHVENINDLRIVKTEEVEPEHFVFSTVVVAPGQAGIQELLKLDPKRKDASLLPIDAPIVICHTYGQTMSASNQVAGFTAPDGAYVPQGTSMTLSGTAAVYVTCQAQTRVTLIINRRGNA